MTKQITTTGATFAQRLDAIRAETESAHADNLRVDRLALDARLTALVSHRAHQIADALLSG